uniref:Uncharacterized protein n=1 Tax=Mesocestoides corti TaxID=53468 RepID=A0A5K3EWP5_MESCO
WNKSQSGPKLVGRKEENRVFIYPFPGRPVLPLVRSAALKWRHKTSKRIGTQSPARRLMPHTYYLRPMTGRHLPFHRSGDV